MSVTTEHEIGFVGLPKSEQSTARLSVNLPTAIMEELKDLSRIEGVSLTEIVRRAISAEKFLRQQAEEGNKILVLEKGQSKPSRVVVFR